MRFNFRRRWKSNPVPQVEFGAYSHVGQVRSENQDAYGHFPAEASGQEHLFLVADGMGGHAHGSEASHTAVQVIQETFFAQRNGDVLERLRRAFAAANARIFEATPSPFEKMGTTGTAFVLHEGKAYIGHVGDTRIYRINRSGIDQLTRDHTLVQKMLLDGLLTEEEAKTYPRRHTLMRALGMYEEVEVDVFEVDAPGAGEGFLLCSDGLAEVSPEEIQDIARAVHAQKACEQLVALANERGGQDNVTVLLIWSNGRS